MPTKAIEVLSGLPPRLLCYGFHQLESRDKREATSSERDPARYCAYV